jgi:hypothetical protein
LRGKNIPSLPKKLNYFLTASILTFDLINTSIVFYFGYQKNQMAHRNSVVFVYQWNNMIQLMILRLWNRKCLKMKSVNLFETQFSHQKHWSLSSTSNHQFYFLAKLHSHAWLGKNNIRQTKCGTQNCNQRRSSLFQKEMSSEVNCLSQTSLVFVNSCTSHKQRAAFFSHVEMNRGNDR